MLKPRIIGVLVVKNKIVVQSYGFQRYLPVGIPEIAIEYLDRWGIDEIVVLDIDATVNGITPDFAAVESFSKHCQVPLTIGGGIRNVKNMEEIVRRGADKVVINSAAVENPDLINDGAWLFGNQCIVVSIDARRVKEDQYEVFTHSGRKSTGYSPEDFARLAQEKGAGEILLNSIDRDGTQAGYDLNLVKKVADSVTIPVIVCGGVGHPMHFAQGLECGVSAAAAANYFHHTEHSVITTKRYLTEKGLKLRLDTYTDYAGFHFDESGRSGKVDDDALDRLRFEYTPEEVI